MPEKYLVQRRTASGLETVAELPMLAGDKIDISLLPVVGTMGSAVIESGENANGRYIKWADGTMICTHTYVKEPRYSDFLFLTGEWVLPIANVGTVYKLVVGFGATTNDSPTANHGVYTSIGYQGTETYVWSTGSNSAVKRLADAIRTGGSFGVVSYTAYLVAIGRWK
ncbi:hypothetical protein [Cloacibacillus evryensis]|uniref:hypothetical protein n=1 Tax=Cloacibacillus evryensis TaxID=508460 RepID=UPI00044F0290|nr:hypothetical protein [Cloacibacillus evryensis]EXG78377.1 hypothetical protein Cloev_0496 [Cloacibacillus evryensis DSM 19522]MEA5035081.1 hypothetical protein [Cloacibacillus evryensis]